MPGVRDPDGAGGRRHRGRARAGRHLHLLRRHDAGAGQHGATCSRPRPTGPTSASSTRRSTRSGSPRRTRTAQVVFFAVGFETTAPSTALTLLRGTGARGDQLHRVLQPRHDRAAAAGHPRVPRPAPRRVPRARARVHGGRPAPLPLRARRVRAAAGDGRLRAPRHPARHRHAAGPDPGGPLRGGEPVLAGRARGGQPARPGGAGRGLRAAPPLRVARSGLHRAERAEAAARVRRLRRRAALRPSPTSGWPTPRRASAARCSRV